MSASSGARAASAASDAPNTGGSGPCRRASDFIHAHEQATLHAPGSGGIPGPPREFAARGARGARVAHAGAGNEEQRVARRELRRGRRAGRDVTPGARLWARGRGVGRREERGEEAGEHGGRERAERERAEGEDVQRDLRRAQLVRRDGRDVSSQYGRGVEGGGAARNGCKVTV